MTTIREVINKRGQVKGTISARGQIKGNIKETFLKGDQGYSAYDIAVQNGFDGDVQEWLASLIGETGTSIIGTTLNNDYTLTILFSDGSRYTTPSIRGARGNSVSSIELNNDYSLSITLSDGEVYTTSSIRGEKGDRGDDGVSITDTLLNADYTLTISFSDGSTYTTPSIRGRQGEKGDTGNGINTAVLNNDYTLTLTFDDGTTYTTPQIRGEKGDTGTGIASVVLNNNYTLTITLDDGTVYTTPSIRGQQGEKGDTGTGISSVVLNNNYTLTITLDDGTAYTTPSIRGEKGDAGFSPTASVNKLGNAATITITDQNGTSTATITDGAKGDDGFSPTVAINNITGGHQVVVTDESGNHSFNVMDGESGVYIGDTEPTDPDVNVWIDTDEGADDVVTDVQINNTSILNNGVANIPVASANTFGVVKVDPNGTGIGIDNTGVLAVNPAQDNAIKSGTGYTPIVPKRQHQSVFYGLAKVSGDTTQAQSNNAVGTYTNEAKSAIQSMLGVPSEDDVVTDVQVNGTSVINNGVANIPLANNLAPGVVKLASADLGVGMDNNDYLCVVTANADLIKSGNTSYRPITPKRQHESVFYGLAKAAGDSTQSASSNSVGTYTEEAKIAIQKMLGIYEPPFELIEDFTLAEEGRFDKTTEPDGTLYNFRGVFIRVFYAANLQTASTGYGRYMCEDSAGTSINTETGKYTTQTNPYTKFVYIMRNGAMAIAVYSRAAATGGAVSWQHKDNSGIKFDFKNIQRIYMNAADVEPAGTRIQIYAQRAY